MHCWHSHDHIKDSVSSAPWEPQGHPWWSSEGWQSFPECKRWDWSVCIKASSCSFLLPYVYSLRLVPYTDFPWENLNPSPVLYLINTETLSDLGATPSEFTHSPDASFSTHVSVLSSFLGHPKMDFRPSWIVVGKTFPGPMSELSGKWDADTSLLFSVFPCGRVFANDQGFASYTIPLLGGL